MGFEKKKKICHIRFNASDTPARAFQDCGMFLYTLAKDFNWESTYVFYKTRPEETQWNQTFLKYVRPVCLGETDDLDYKKQVSLAKKFIQEHIHEYDAIMLFHYGSTAWKLAKFCKKYNSNVVVYIKLDMGIGGFNHFCNNGPFQNLKNWFEKFKSSYVDIFTVETKSYYEELKKTSVFKNRIEYLPNGVSLIDIDVDGIDALPKENSIVTIGRLGIPEKNSSLLLRVIEKMPESLVKQWKFLLIGPSTQEFIEEVHNFKVSNPNISDSIIMVGPVTDRNELYTYGRKAKIICMTSLSESTCISTLESMYFGAYPIITNYSDFVMDTTNKGTCGIIVENGNADELAQQLINAMKNDNLLINCNKSQDYARSAFNYRELSYKLDLILRRYMETNG
jgi:glycosyltransferase, group 1 family protein